MKPPEHNAFVTKCDLKRIQDFLNSDHYHLEDADLMAHLEKCPSCRHHLEAQAGEPLRWQQAAQLLQTHEFDQASSDEFSAATHCGVDAAQPVAVKDVLDMLIPSEYPNHLGRLGTYEVTGVIGVGGMGVVLKAIDPSLDRVVAEKLAMHEAWLALDSLVTIDLESAERLAKRKHWLTLDGLKSLTPEIADALGRYDGDKLDLNGLESLELEVAKPLSNAKCASGINLNGLKEVSPEVIEVLANGNSHLSFQGLEFMDMNCSQALENAEKNLRAVGKLILWRKADQPLLNLDSYRQEGSHSKGKTQSHLWKLRGQSVESIGIRALHIKDGNSHVVSEGVFPVEAQQQSIEVHLQLKSLDEPIPSNGQSFVPSLSVAINGVTTNADKGEQFTILGEFTTHSASTSGQRNFEDIILRAGSDTNGISPSTIDSMIATSKKGVDFFVVILTWQPIAETNQKVGNEAAGI